MIPVRLELKNFLPYRSPDPVLFEGIHLACLTGNNGAGKSSLLDAITWALWGRARARRDDDLVHLGQGEMYVQLDFEQEGVTYRVLRRRKAGRRGFGSLDLFVVQDNHELRTINEPSMKLTQQRIDSILHLDYETFVNSAFLQQGKADAFTTKTPAQRKQILSDILGLAQWAQYEERAKEKLRELERSLASVDGVLQAIEEELAKQPRYEQELVAAQSAYEIAQDALAAAEEQLEAVQDAPAELRAAQEQQASSTRRLQNYANDLQSLAQDIQQRETVIQQQKDLLEQSEQIEAGYQTLQAAREADSTLGAKLHEMHDLEQRYNDVQQQIQAVRSQLEQELHGYQVSIQEAERVLAETIDEELAQVSAEIAALEQREQQRTELQEQLSATKERRSALQTLKKALTEEGKELNERITKLDDTQGGATCPLCGQALTDEHRERVLSEVIQQRDDMREQYRQANQDISEATTRTQALQEQIEAIGKELAALPKLRSRAGALEKQSRDAQAAQKRRDEAQAALNAVQHTLDTEDYALELRQQLNALHEERKAIGYDRSEHESVQSQLSDYQRYEREYTRLEVARETLPREQSALESALERQQRTEAILEEERKQQQHIEQEIQRLELLVQEYHKRQAEVNRQRTAVQQAYGGVVEAQQQINALEMNRQRKQNLQEKREEMLHQQNIYHELRQAFGKNGVPLMVIEAAIPELEATSNQLLARMTDGRMHLRFSTQRARASGKGSIETLDIEIADELGTRPYEMYSGGEAFRINFAVRVALSKLLARRAGAQLRTLFIDEGFGTQDGDGRNKLVEAITAIQREFDLILVITHIDELRDAFPVHVVVEKTDNGSMIALR